MDNEGASVLDAMNYFSPTLPIRNEDGSWTKGSGSKNYNPLSLINENTSEGIYKNTQVIGKATLKIIEGLNWNANYSFTNSQSTYSSYDTHNTQLEGISAYNGRATRSTSVSYTHLPAAATSNARFTFSCPFTSAKSRSKSLCCA